jgi:hypothetical protein
VLIRQGDTRVIDLGAPALLFFLERDIVGADIDDPQVRAAYCALDDTDILYSTKQWVNHGDSILADLSRRFLNRDFLRVRFLPREATREEIEEWETLVGTWLIKRGLSASVRVAEDVACYFVVDRAGHAAYTFQQGGIDVLMPDAGVQELSTVTDSAAVSSLTPFVEKPFVCYPKEVALPIGAVEASDSLRSA